MAETLSLKSFIFVVSHFIIFFLSKQLHEKSGTILNCKKILPKKQQKKTFFHGKQLPLYILLFKYIRFQLQEFRVQDEVI